VNDLNENELPILTLSRMEVLLFTYDLLTTEIPLPTRDICLRESDDPRFRKFKILVDDPHRANDRIESALLTEILSKIETFPPMTFLCFAPDTPRLMELPSLANALNEIEDPIDANPRTDKSEP
jgi:hypothetical protein